MQVCTSLQTDNHASTSPLSFLQAGCPSYCPTNSIKALKAILNKNNKQKLQEAHYWIYGWQKYFRIRNWAPVSQHVIILQCINLFSNRLYFIFNIHSFLWCQAFSYIFDILYPSLYGNINCHFDYTVVQKTGPRLYFAIFVEVKLKCSRGLVFEPVCVCCKVVMLLEAFFCLKLWSNRENLWVMPVISVQITCYILCFLLKGTQISIM